jgi:hypothetical protein
MVVARFRDGSQLRGTPKCESISVKTSYANLTLLFKDLSSVDFTRDRQSLRISFRNGDIVQATLNAALCQLKTIVGDVSIDPKDLISIQIQIQPVSPDSDLMGYYPLDGNVNDASGNHNDGIAVGLIPTSNRLGVPGAAVWFDGVRSAISVPSNPTMHPHNQLTVTFWIRADRLAGYSPIFHKGGPVRGNFANREFAAYIKDTDRDFFHFEFYSAGDGNGQHEALSNGSYPLQHWLFVAVVFDRKDHKVRLFVDDVLEAQTADSYSSFNANDFPLTIGVEAESTFSDHSPFVGAIDELRLYKRALTREEIQTLRESP